MLLSLSRMREGQVPETAAETTNGFKNFSVDEFRKKVKVEEMAEKEDFMLYSNSRKDPNKQDSRSCGGLNLNNNDEMGL
mgnify:CR=1 FL=1|jgi:hypothetical protein